MRGARGSPGGAPVVPRLPVRRVTARRRCHSSCPRSRRPRRPGPWSLLAPRMDTRKQRMPPRERRPASAARAGRAPAGVCLCALLLVAALDVPRVGAARRLAQAGDAAPQSSPAPPPSNETLSGLFSQSAPTCTVQLNASSSKDGASVTGTLRMQFPTASSDDESDAMVFFTEKPIRKALRLPNNTYLVGDRFNNVFPDSPPNAALTGAIITEGSDIAAVNMIIQINSAVAEFPTSADTSPSTIVYAFMQSPAQQSASIIPPGNVSSATVIVGCGLLLDGGFLWPLGSYGLNAYG